MIEKNAEKIAKAAPFQKATSIDCLQETTRSEFDAVVNACPDPIAFCQAIAKLSKGGHFAFFSGLTKNQQIETNLINTLHDKEAAVVGACGLTREHMVRALDLIGDHSAAFEHLVEAMVHPRRLPDILTDVLAGRSFKYILDFSGIKQGHLPAGPPQEPNRPTIDPEKVAKGALRTPAGRPRKMAWTSCAK